MMSSMEINLMKMKSTKATRHRHVGVAHPLCDGTWPHPEILFRSQLVES